MISSRDIRICGIYCLTNRNGERYIGKSVNVYQRAYQHGYGRKHRKSTRWEKLEILVECDRDALSDLEWEWCYKLKPELNKSLPAIDSFGEKYWTNPNARTAQLKRRNKAA